MITERAPSKMKGGPGGYSHGRYCSCVFQPHCVHLPDSWQPEGRHHICRDRGSRIVKFGWNCNIGQNCEIWRKLWNLVNPHQFGLDESDSKQWINGQTRNFCHCHCVCLRCCLFVGQVMFPHHSDQMSQSSKVSNIALWRCYLNIFY